MLSEIGVLALRRRGIYLSSPAPEALRLACPICIVLTPPAPTTYNSFHTAALPSDKHGKLGKKEWLAGSVHRFGYPIWTR